MSDAPRRQIGGLTALERMRGPVGEPGAEPATAAPEASVAAQAPGSPPQAPERASEAARAPQAGKKPTARATRRAEAVQPAPRAVRTLETTAPDKMTTYIDHSTRVRARATYKATAHLEDDGTFSGFVEAAIARELERREQLYNNGQPYAGDGGRLSAGRPLS